MKKRYLKVPLMLGVVLILVILIVKLISSIVSAPARGVIETNSTKQQVVKSTLNLKPELISNPYSSFDYPTLMSTDTNSPFTNPIIAENNFSYKDIETWGLAISILNVPSGSLNDNTGYLYRETNPTIYSLSKEKIGENEFNIMTDTTVGGFSKIAFTTDGQYQADISLYGDDTTGITPLDQTFQMVLNSWHWK